MKDKPLPVIRGITVCVGYDDILSITLPRNCHCVDEMLVVSDIQDAKVKEVVRNCPNARIFETDAFQRHGAHFNKGLALEEGFEHLGRDGWICVLDADTLLPDRIDASKLSWSKLYSAPRRILQDPKAWHPHLDWRTLPIRQESVFPGYFHLFHASDPHLEPLPWYDVTFAHAGGGDGFFQSRWPRSRKVRLPFQVLHIGPPDKNWFGRASERLDGRDVSEIAGKRMKGLLEAYQRGTYQPRTLQNHTASCPYMDRDYQEHVQIPGHEPRIWIYKEE